MHRFIALFLLSNCIFSASEIKSQKESREFGHDCQIAAKATLGWMRPTFRFADDFTPAILNNDKISNVFIMPEIEVHTPVGLTASLGYYNASIKPSSSKVVDQLESEHPGMTISESDNNFDAYFSGISPGIGWRFQFVEKTFIQPHAHYLSGRYANAEALFSLRDDQTNATQTIRYEKGLHKLQGFGFGLNIITEYQTYSDRVGIWYGLQLGWSHMRTTGDLTTISTDDFGTATSQSQAFDKTWSCAQLGLSVGLYIGVSKDKAE